MNNLNNNEPIEEKICTNCKYYLRHYVNYSGNFVTTGSAHCTEKRISAKRLNQMIENKTLCELWELSDLKEKRKQRVEYAIVKLAKLLEDYLQILKLELSE